VQPPAVNSGPGPQVAPPPAVQAPPQQQPASAAPSPTAQVLNAVAPSPVVNEATPAVTPTALPPTVVPTPTPRTYDAARLTDRLGSAQTSYAGSIPERAWNVELAAKRLDGTTVPPGGIFSFNQAVGSTTLKSGFKIGYGIANGKDGIPETVPSVAGGICQIATTVFQAAFWAGFPFVERHYHLYWIPRYGAPPTGRTGYDATVDDPGVDLKFKNTTDDWIRLNAWFDGANVGFVIRGVEPGWKVEASTPKIFDVVKTSPEVVKQEDPTMPAGRELDVEHAEDGFKVTVRRLVTLKGKTVDDYVFTNSYRPSRNVVLVGTKGATPTPVLTPTPAATAASTPVAPPTPTPVKAATKLADGKVVVPSLVGLPEAQARKLVEQSGLNNTYTNYQGPGQVPAQALNAVEVGSVLSQQPAPGSPAAPGTTIHLAVRKG
jgi:vancomycin resistance protein YoaR